MPRVDRAPRPDLLLAAVLAGLAPAALAQDEDADVEAPGANQGRVSLEVGSELSSAYFWRGYVLENSGLVTQPYVELSFALADGGDGGPWVDFSIGNWNSFHSEQTDATDDTSVPSWYEADFYGGLALGWDWGELGLEYLYQTYPNSDFNDVGEIVVTSTFYMPEAIGAWTGDLSLELGVEVDNSNIGDDEAIFLGVALGPEFELFGGAATLSIPVELGFSVDDFYLDENGDDDAFGYGAIGIELEVPLTDGDYGAWTLTGGVSMAFLGDALEEAHPDGDDDELWGFVGISMSY